MPEKLVRDRIIEMIRAKGREPEWRVAVPEEYRGLLIEKLREEVEEFVRDGNEMEIADVLEVIDAIVVERGFSRQRIDEVKRRKFEERGGFAVRHVLSQPERRKKIVAVSGGFDPVHIGHVRLFQEAKALGDELVVILNNDNWLKKKKGYAFMPQDERKEVIASIGCVDRVEFTSHDASASDMSVCAELRELRPDVFANGGDRKRDNVPEAAVCEEIGCVMAWNVGAGGKVQSSSWLINNAGEMKEKLAAQ